MPETHSRELSISGFLSYVRTTYRVLVTDGLDRNFFDSTLVSIEKELKRKSNGEFLPSHLVSVVNSVLTDNKFEDSVDQVIIQATMDYIGRECYKLEESRLGEGDNYIPKEREYHNEFRDAA